MNSRSRTVRLDRWDDRVYESKRKSETKAEKDLFRERTFWRGQLLGLPRPHCGQDGQMTGKEFKSPVSKDGAGHATNLLIMCRGTSNAKCMQELT